MPVKHIHAFLVHPKKGKSDSTQSPGTEVPLSGSMFDFLQSIYAKADSECRLEITFVNEIDGSQSNEFRTLMLQYISKPSLATGHPLSERLGACSDMRSSLGLLFLIHGKEDREHKLVISRFPTDSAIYVEEQAKSLTVAFLDRVFMKNKSSYKSVIYRDVSLKSEFWTGRAIDTQTASQRNPSSEYWIADFLLSDFTLTPAQGTSRFARALRAAANGKIPIEVKQEITAAARLSNGIGNKRVSIAKLMENFNLTGEARAAIIGALPKPSLANEYFLFDETEFKSLIAYKSVELDNGAILTADAKNFDEVFTREKSHGEMRFATMGNVINEKLTPTRPR